MRKKIIYGILFLTLFMVSTASMVQPVYAYEIGLPDEIIDQEIVAEIKIYNEDEWEKCLGKDGFGPDDIWEGDADVVGARQLVIIRDFGDVDGTEGPGDNDLGDKIPGFEAITRGLYPQIDGLMVPGFTQLAGGAALTGATTSTITGGATGGALAFAGATTALKNSTQILAAFNKKWEGGLLWRDRWFFNEDWETDEDFGDVDEADLEAEDKWDGWGPIYGDPRDRRELQLALKAWKDDFLQTFDAVRTPLLATYLDFFNSTNPVVGFPAFEMTTESNATYIAMNNTIANTPALAGLAGSLGMIFPKNWSVAHNGPDMMVNGDYVWSLFNALDFQLASIAEGINYATPFDNKFAMYLAFGPDGGMPCLCDSAEDYVRRMTEEFNFNDEVLYGLPWAAAGKDLNGDGTISPLPYGLTNNFGIPLGGETMHMECYADVSVEGATVTIEIEWPDDTIDPADSLLWPAPFTGDGEDELKDFEVVYAVSVEVGLGGGFVTRGDTIIWQAGSVDQIPGYELTILLGVSGISVLALVYIIMKKRRK
jgi:hypothetical protein